MTEDTKFNIAVTAFISVVVLMFATFIYFAVKKHEKDQKILERKVDVECMATLAPVNPNGITLGNVRQLVDFCTEPIDSD